MNCCLPFFICCKFLHLLRVVTGSFGTRLEEQHEFHWERLPLEFKDTFLLPLVYYLFIYFLVTLNKSCFTDHCCYCYYIFLQICATLCSFHIPILPMQKILFLGHPSAFDLVDGSNAIQSVVHLGATQRKWVAPPVWIPNLSCFNVLPSYLFFVASLPYSQPPSVPGVMYKMIAVLPHTSIMPNLRVITYPLFLLLLDPGPLSAW